MSEHERGRLSTYLGSIEWRGSRRMALVLGILVAHGGCGGLEDIEPAQRGETTAGLDNDCLSNPTLCPGQGPIAARKSCYTLGQFTTSGSGYTYTDSAGTDGANGFSGASYPSGIVTVAANQLAPPFSSLSSSKQRDIVRFMNNSVMNTSPNPPVPWLFYDSRFQAAVLDSMAPTPALGGYFKWIPTEGDLWGWSVVYWNATTNCAYSMASYNNSDLDAKKILDKYKVMTGADGQAYEHSVLGLPTSEPFSNPPVNGSAWQRFTNGYIVYRPGSSSAFYTGGIPPAARAVGARYGRLFEYPGNEAGINYYSLWSDIRCADADTCLPSSPGFYSRPYDDATHRWIYVVGRNNQPTAHAVTGLIADTWASLPGGSIYWPWLGPLGYPTSDEETVDIDPLVTRQTFQNGSPHTIYTAPVGPPRPPVVRSQEAVISDDLHEYIRYDQVRMKSAHNSYNQVSANGTNVDLWDMLTYYGIRSIELDIHPARPDGNGWVSHSTDWFVYHTGAYSLDDYQSRCERLSDCLRLLKEWHDKNPDHEVITIFSDAYDGVFSPGEVQAGRGATDFDWRLGQALGSSLFRPGDLMALCPTADPPTLKGAIATCGWPTLQQLRGRFLYVFTNDSGVSTYLNSFPSQTVSAAFGASGSYPSSWDVIFYNSGSCGSDPHCVGQTYLYDFGQSEDAWNAGFVTRVYSLDAHVNSNNAGWDRALRTFASDPTRYPANHLAQFQTTQSSFRTYVDGGHGYPFECIDSICDTSSWVEGFGAPMAPALTLTATSGVLPLGANLPDGQVMRYRTTNEANLTRNSWSTSVFGPRVSSTAGSSYGCLMARATADATSPYAAICRDDDPFAPDSIVFTYRAAPGSAVYRHGLVAPTGDLWPGDTPTNYSIESQNAVYLWMDVFRDGSGNHVVSVYASRNGVGDPMTTPANWSPRYSVTIPVSAAGTLAIQGLAVSTNGASTKRYFLDTRHEYRTNATAFNSAGTLVYGLDPARAADLPSTLLSNDSVTAVLEDFEDGLGFWH